MIVMTRNDTADGDGAPHVCAYCGRAFARPDWLALHRGLAHEARLNDGERAAFADAREREAAALRKFRLKALAVLVVLYFGFVMAYSFFG